MRALVALALTLACTAPALAQTKGCEVLNEASFRGLVLQTTSAIDRGDVGLNRQILAEINHRIPCLSFAPDTRIWADYLIARAIDAFVQKGDWQYPLNAALALNPNVNRGVGGAHPIARYEPPSAESFVGAPVSSKVEFYVNGSRAESLPSPEGLTLIQRRDGKWWNSMLLLDESINQLWLDSPAPGPPRIRMQGDLGIGISFRGTQQDQELTDAHPNASDAFPQDSGRAVVVAHIRGETSIFSNFGMVGEASHPLAFGNGIQGDGRIAVMLKPRRFLIGAGLGLTTIDAYTARAGSVTSDTMGQDDRELADPQPAGCGWNEQACWTPTYMAFPHVIAQARGSADHPWDVGVVVGWRPAIAHFEVYGGIPLKASKTLRPRLGAKAVITRAALRSEGTSRNVNVVQARAILEMTILVGEP